MSAKVKFWIAGLVITIAGLLLAKVISPGYANQPVVQLSTFLAGVVVTIAGLGIILAGLRK